MVTIMDSTMVPPVPQAAGSLCHRGLCSPVYELYECILHCSETGYPGGLLHGEQSPASTPVT